MVIGSPKNQYFYRDTISRLVCLKEDLKEANLPYEVGYPAPDTNLEFIPLRYLFVLSALRDCVTPLTGSLTRICSGLR